MKIRSFVTTYSNTSNQHNYFMNGLIKDEIRENSCIDSCEISKIRNLYALADGSKSGLGGDETAFLCMDMMCEILGANFETQRHDFFDVMHNVVKGRAFESQCKDPHIELGALYIEGTCARAYNAGGVSVFHFRDNKIEKISGRMPEKAEVDEICDENGRISVKKVLKQTVPYIGAFTESSVVVPYTSRKIKLKKNDFFVIMTESVSALIDEKEITEILSNKEISANEKAQAIVNSAVQKSLDGNYTAEVIEICDDFKIAGMKASAIGIIIACLIAVSMIFAFSAKSENDEGFMKKFEKSVSDFMYGTDSDADKNLTKQWVPIERSNK